MPLLRKIEATFRCLLNSYLPENDPFKWFYRSEAVEQVPPADIVPENVAAPVATPVVTEAVAAPVVTEELSNPISNASSSSKASKASKSSKSSKASKPSELKSMATMFENLIGKEELSITLVKNKIIDSLVFGKSHSFHLNTSRGKTDKWKRNQDTMWKYALRSSSTWWKKSSNRLNALRVAFAWMAAPLISPRLLADLELAELLKKPTEADTAAETLKKKKDEEKIQKLRDKGIVQRESRRRPTRNNVNYGTIDHELEEALAQSALMYHDGDESSTSSSSSSSMVRKSKRTETVAPVTEPTVTAAETNETGEISVKPWVYEVTVSTVKFNFGRFITTVTAGKDSYTFTNVAFTNVAEKDTDEDAEEPYIFPPTTTFKLHKMLVLSHSRLCAFMQAQEELGPSDPLYTKSLYKKT